MKLSDEDIRKLTLEALSRLGENATPDKVRSVVAKSIERIDDSFTASESGDSGRVILTAFGLDKPGIVAAITTIISQSGGDIIDLTQKLMDDFFTMIMIIDISAVKESFKEFQEKLSAEAEKMGFKLYVQHEDIFRKMHRV